MKDKFQQNDVGTSLRLGVIGMSEGNGHPYSWSAIFNGYDDAEMRSCPFPVIPDYLSKQTFPQDCIPHARVTHIWTQDKKNSKHIAASSRIDHVVDRFEDMIGEVDAILLARDDAENHLSISVPFLDAGMPVYIDKPIATHRKALDAILAHEQYPGQIFSCSALRFAEEFNPHISLLEELGSIEYVEATVGKSWHKYAVHIIDPVLHLLRLTGEPTTVQVIKLMDKQLMIAQWKEVTVKFTTLGHLSAPITIRLYGTKSSMELKFVNSFLAFKRALEAFICGLTTRRHMITHDELKDVVSLIELGMV